MGKLTVMEKRNKTFITLSIIMILQIHVDY